jgi:cation-transporting ATPase E
MLLSDAAHPARRQADQIASTGSRVLVLLHADSGEIGDSVSQNASAVALVVLAEQVRPDAAETLAYFTAQGVGLKIISGDNPHTVAAVARRVGVEVEEAYDARNLPSLESEIAEVLERHSVFGRVSPEQKQAMVSALQSKGHVVAMTGDGVNDALALKRADIGVAMGSGAPATRAVAEIVLLDGRFDRLPGVVAEGRRVIANVERVSNLFVSKTTYAALIAIAVIVLAIPYPFLPRHLTIVSTITIGVPAFFLALAPNAQIYRPGFVRRVLKFAIPAGTVATITVLLTYLFARSQSMNLTQERTLATLSLVVVGLWILTLLARPLTRGRYLLLLILVALLLVGAAVPFMSSFFAIEFVSVAAVLETLLISAVGCSVLEVWWRVRRAA